MPPEETEVVREPYLVMHHQYSSLYQLEKKKKKA